MGGLILPSLILLCDFWEKAQYDTQNSLDSAPCFFIGIGVDEYFINHMGLNIEIGCMLYFIFVRKNSMRGVQFLSAALL